MNVFNFFKFLEDKEGRKIPSRAKLLDPEYVFDINDFKDEDGDIDLQGYKTPILLDNLTVEGNLLLSSTPIKSLPDNLTVAGSLVLAYCQNLQSLPNNLKVGGLLDLYRCNNIQSLPKDLKVYGILNVTATPLANYTAKEIKQMCPDIIGDINGAKRK